MHCRGLSKSNELSSQVDTFAGNTVETIRSFVVHRSWKNYFSLFPENTENKNLLYKPFEYGIFVFFYPIKANLQKKKYITLSVK